MKPLFWTKIQPQKLSNTIWPELDDCAVELDLPRLEASFGQKAKPKETEAKSKARKVPAKTTVNLLDANRTQNLGIQLAR